jgi:hypothetical protein
MVDVGIGWGHGIVITDNTKTYPATSLKKPETRDSEMKKEKTPEKAVEKGDYLPEDQSVNFIGNW